MKKFSVVVLFVISIMSVLVGCSPSSSKVSASNNRDFTIGIVQLADHPALDDARKGFEDGLKELNVNTQIKYQNAQGDIPTTLSISQKFVNDNMDLIYTIATPAAQSAKQVAKNIPVLFSAVTDPVEAELVNSMENPGENITGTSDLSPMDRQIQIFKDLNKEIKKIGIIYSTSEPNSEIQVREAKKIAKELELEIIDIGISNINDIPLALESIVKKVDGLYTITDNMVASSISIVAKKATENNLITVGAEESHVKGGILITDGISYYELGKQTARMAKEILVDGKSPSEIPVETAISTTKVFNEETLNLLNLDKENKVFKDSNKIN